VTGFRVAWWRKDIPDLKAAYRELKRVKTGRLARLKGKVETAEAPGEGAPSPSLPAKISATAEAMRAAGAPEADIEEFMNGSTA
jgi:hypothetical protein